MLARPSVSLVIRESDCYAIGETKSRAPLAWPFAFLGFA